MIHSHLKFHVERRTRDWPDELLLEHAEAWARVARFANEVVAQEISRDRSPLPAAELGEIAYRHRIALTLIVDHRRFAKIWEECKP